MGDAAKSVHYHALFDCDVREAAGWYDRCLPGLGDIFVEKVRVAVNKIIADPRRFAHTSLSGIRYARVAKFPYVVLFDTDGECLEFFAVLHTARDIGKWRERLEP